MCVCARVCVCVCVVFLEGRMSGGEGDGVDVMDDGPPEGWGVDWCHVAHEMQVRNAELMFKIDDQQEKIEELEAKVGGALMQSSSR